MQLKKNIKLGKIKIRKYSYLTFLFLILTFKSFASDLRFVEVKILDKVSSKTSQISLNIDEEIKFENLNIKDGLYVGIRPEDISLENKSEYTAEITVDLIENLGSEKIIYSHLNNTEIRIKSAKNIKDKKITIYFQKNKIYLFDNKKNRLKSL